jgi:hypothetical protein
VEQYRRVIFYLPEACDDPDGGMYSMATDGDRIVGIGQGLGSNSDEGRVFRSQDGETCRLWESL